MEWPIGEGEWNMPIDANELRSGSLLSAPPARCSSTISAETRQILQHTQSKRGHEIFTKHSVQSVHICIDVSVGALYEHGTQCTQTHRAAQLCERRHNRVHSIVLCCTLCYLLVDLAVYILCLISYVPVRVCTGARLAIAVVIVVSALCVRIEGAPLFLHQFVLLQKGVQLLVDGAFKAGLRPQRSQQQSSCVQRSAGRLWGAPQTLPQY